jgi:zinc transport system substrate-binding protein
MRGWRDVVAALFLSAVLLAGCGQRVTPASSDMEIGDPLPLTVSILPQKYFLERIGGHHVRVNVMVLPGESPATYEPKPEQLAALSMSMAYFSIGVPFEDAWLDRIAAANEDMVVVDTAAGIDRVPGDGHYKVALGGRPEEGSGGASAAGGRDPHIWLSPSLVKVQSRNIYEALVALDPDNEGHYRANWDRFVADIDDLMADIEAALADVEQRKFMVFHPSWGYFGDDFRLEMIPIQVGGQEPSAAELARLVAVAEAEDIRVIFAQPEFSTEDAETIAKEIDGEVLLISPLALEWLDNMRRVAETFAQVLGG